MVLGATQSQVPTLKVQGLRHTTSFIWFNKTKQMKLNLFIPFFSKSNTTSEPCTVNANVMKYCNFLCKWVENIRKLLILCLFCVISMFIFWSDDLVVSFIVSKIEKHAGERANKIVWFIYCSKCCRVHAYKGTAKQDLAQSRMFFTRWHFISWLTADITLFCKRSISWHHSVL